MREIVTVQVGGFANFIGSHFWNFQDELLGLVSDVNADPLFKHNCFDMDVLYRTGENHNGILTYTPRLLSIDIQGSLGTMSSHGTLYKPAPEVAPHVATWRGAVSTHRSEPHKKNLFLQSLEEQDVQMNDINIGHTASENAIHDEDIVQSLENSVQFWSDFSKVHYHPQSLYELTGLWMNAQDFDNYGIGKDVFTEGSRGEEMSDRLRFFVEECDHIQGIQFIVDDSGGFSSVAADFLEDIADEYANTPVLLYAARGPSSFMNYGSSKPLLLRNLHDAVSFSRLSSLCKLVVPVGLPSLCTSKASSYLSIDDRKPYHCSAVYAAALHSLSLPFRMQLYGPTANTNLCSGAMDIKDLIQILASLQSPQHIVAILDAAMPAPLLTGSLPEQPILHNLQPLTPEVLDIEEDMQSVESLTIHGCLNSGCQRASVSEVQDGVSAGYGKGGVRPRFCHLSVTVCPLPIPLPFPKIFNNIVGKDGEVMGTPALNLPPKGPLDVDSIPMAARLRSSSAISPFMSTRLENLGRLGIQPGAPGAELLRSWGFGKEELEDMGETLANMAKAAAPFASSSDDSD